MQALFAASFQNRPSSPIRQIWDKLSEVDPAITQAAPEWPLDKLNPIDLAILRLANALDRQQRQLLSLREIKKTGSGIEIIVEAIDLDAVSEEKRSFDVAKSLFEQVFACPITLTIGHCSPLH